MPRGFGGPPMMRGPVGAGGFGCLGLFGPLLAGALGFMLGKNMSGSGSSQPAAPSREDELRRREDELRRREDDLRRREDEAGKGSP